MSFADEVEIFHQFDCVYVQWPQERGGGEWSITGTLRGPIWQDVRTLPNTVRLASAGRGPTVLSKASLVEPVFWSPEVPALYDIEAELRRDGISAGSVERSIGIRVLGARRRSLYWRQERWVLRGLAERQITVKELAECHTARAALVVSRPSDALLEAASRLGVLMAVKIEPDDAVTTLRRLSRWAAVAIVVLPSDFDDMRGLYHVSMNLLRAKHVRPGDTFRTCELTDLLFCDASDPLQLARVAEASPLPIVAVRRLNERRSIAENRSACDRLQADLAPVGDFAGYVV